MLMGEALDRIIFMCVAGALCHARDKTASKVSKSLSIIW